MQHIPIPYSTLLKEVVTEGAHLTCSRRSRKLGLYLSATLSRSS